MALPNRSSSVSSSNPLLTVFIVVAALYFARELFIPLALAILFSFLLSPLTTRLRHWHLGRVPSVLLAVLLAFAVVGSVGEFMVGQMVDLGHKLPEYQQNVRKKVESLGAGDSGALGRVMKSFQELRKAVMPAAAPATPAQNGQSQNANPAPVEMRNSDFSPLQIVRTVLGSLVSILVNAFIVVIFVIFMLIEREDLRDRLIRIAGASEINVTTQLMDDAGQRVSRYLLMQLIVNVSYGIPIGVGLYFIGIPNPLLWGMVAALLRYIPYVGPWIAMTMPFAVGLAVDPGWVKPLLIIGLFAVVELTVANVVEPWLYGASTGITPLAILVAAVFWTWLWGPVGLLLSTPLTVCLVSVGRYIPKFNLLPILLGDEPVLTPAVRYYQRMLTLNQPEAAELAKKFLEAKKSLAELYDTMILPALVLAEQDYQRGLLDETKHKFFLQHTHILVDDLAHYDEELKSNVAKTEGREPETEIKAPPQPERSQVLCLPARREADEIAGHMLTQLLRLKGVSVKLIFAPVLAPEILEFIKQAKPALACITAVSAAGLTAARHLGNRLAGDFPELKLMVCIWGSKEENNNLANRFPMASPENVVTGLPQATQRILALISTTAVPQNTR